mgnify:CR=1 FL=1
MSRVTQMDNTSWTYSSTDPFFLDGTNSLPFFVYNVGFGYSQDNNPDPNLNSTTVILVFYMVLILDGNSDHVEQA